MKKLPEIQQSFNNKMNKKHSKSQPFWNPELQFLWTKSCKAEKVYLNFKVKHNDDFPSKTFLRLNFKNAQLNFDKKYRS